MSTLLQFQERHVEFPVLPDLGLEYGLDVAVVLPTGRVTLDLLPVEGHHLTGGLKTLLLVCLVTVLLLLLV